MNEAAFRDLISGQKRGAIAGLCRLGLRGLSFFYGAAVRARNRLFDFGIKRAHVAPVPVVSVGNLTTGGTGKTPFVAWLANWFRMRGLRVVLLSRGYRALPGAVNDEKLVLDLLCPRIPHIQNADRVAGVATAICEHQAQIIILDDGFQHRRLARDLDIVLIDALCPWGYGALLPRGLLREPISGLKRASVVVLTRADQCDDETRRRIISRIEQIRGSKGIVEVAYPPTRLRNCNGETIGFESLQGQTVAAFCGIGNPDGFRRTLSECGLEVAPQLFRTFPDHHHYTADELKQISQLSSNAGAKALLTTQKDLVKIQKPDLDGLPLWAVEIGTNVLTNLELLESQLNTICPARPP